MVTEYPRAWSNFARDAEIIPFPREDVTPPVTKTYLVELDMKNYIVTTGCKVNRSDEKNSIFYKLFVIRDKVFIFKRNGEFKK